MSLLLLALAGTAFTRSVLFARAYFGVACFWFLQFWHDELERSFDHGPEFVSLSLASIVLASVGFGFFAHVSAVRRFVLLFVALNLALPVASEATRKQEHPLPGQAEVLTPPSPVKFEPQGSRDVNVYYVIVDGLTSERVLRDRFALDVQSYTRTFSDAHSFYIARNARASYNVTYLTLSSIFYQTYPVDEQSRPYRDRSLFFPDLLANAERLSLLLNLNKLGYRFTHIGNSWGPCTSRMVVRCITDYGVKSSIIAELANDYAVKVFFEGSLMGQALKELPPAATGKNSVNDDDALRTAIDFVRQHPRVIGSNRNFFLIHHMNPHPPARNEACELLDGGTYVKEDTPGYRSSVLCAFRRMTEFAELISKADKNAIVVFQGDHGAAVTYDFNLPFEELTADHLDERFSIFNALRLPEACRSGLAENLGNVETINLVLGCLGNRLPDNDKPRSYAGFYETRPEFGKVRQVFRSQ